MTSDMAKRELVASRGRGARKFIEEVDFHTEADDNAHHVEVVRARDRAIAEQLGGFKSHPMIESFLMQFGPQQITKRTRFTCLLLRGPSQCGKSLRGEAIFGSDATLVVNCQGLSPYIPSIRHYDRHKHLAILWDEVDEAQVLSNKMIFQATNKVSALGQSACNAFAYERYLFGTAMILCSNTFNFTHSKGKPLSEEDQDWLTKNVFLAELPEGVKWYEESPVFNKA